MDSEGEAEAVIEEIETVRTLQGGSSSSYLVRVWQETGSDSGVRFYFRDLKTGEERYLGDPTRIGELLTRGLTADRHEPARRRDTG